ncbi:acyl-CoA dehydrogenase family protein [Pseudoroseomonas ludipueritiae]|uniref:Acyl-CoA/acyl-ACP dehydrogenase n=1 Tax=Pseudoroseomonas ludipueritiae TaxID=198093 RepID=A0ABR7RBB6_9PROT|nr:acyl-CoA dehydrogenase family protein [Pseudoroseomonas ludipueritiae]MBC9179126.1 acyl-CoA/acyl-ACP dehydrogenase [Pseudoroseomonas ludipueritiae]
MTDTAELDLLRHAARGALSRFPEALGLAHGEEMAPGAVAAAMATAAEHGWTAMLLPEAQGGLGLGMREAAVLAEEVGRSLAPGPFLANLVLLPALAGSGAEWLDALAGAVARGETVVTAYISEAGDGPQARRLVEHAEDSGPLLHLAFSGESPGSLTLARLERPNLRPLRPFDPTCPIAEIGEAVATEMVKISAAAARDAVGRAQLWIAAEMLGLSERAGEMSLAYATTRKQFGSPIGVNQAVKHRLVDDYVLRRNAAAIIAEAAAVWDAGQGDRLLLAHAARAAATAAAFSSTAYCIQVHGALGFSAETGIHLGYKRARRLACTLGDEARSRKLIAAEMVRDAA